MSKRTITQQGTVNPMSDSAPVNALKCQFITDMELAGMAHPSRKRYLFAVERLIKPYWCSPAEPTEQQVNDYMLERHRQDPAKGTFKVMHFALRFFFREALGRDWNLFKKKMKPLRQMRLAAGCRVRFA
jgi:hypothetical protein